MRNQFFGGLPQSPLVGLWVMGSASGGGVTPPSAETPALFQSVNANGWSATYASPPTPAPHTAPEYFTVTRQGYAADATPTTVKEDLIVMARVRQPYPNQASLTADQVSLSDYIYATDVVAGSANNSTLSAPKPIAMWLTPDMEHVTGSTLIARLAVAHAHARAAKPVAAVKFIASDGTHTVEQIVSTMSSRQWSATGLYASYFESSIDISTLTQGICTLDAIIYPWVGTPFQISLDADAYPSANLCVRKFVADHSGGYGRAHVYVSLAGNDATGVVSTNDATAAASPYATQAAAVTALKAFNLANFGRNEAGGGVLHLTAGVFTMETLSTLAGTVTSPMTFMGTGASTTTLKDRGVYGGGSHPQPYVRFEAMTLLATAANLYSIGMGSGIGVNGLMVMKDVTIDTTLDNTWIAKPGRMFMENVYLPSANALSTSAGSTKCIDFVGTNAPTSTSGNRVYNAVASRFVGVGQQTAITANQASVGPLVMNNYATSKATAGTLAMNNVNTGSRGVAAVGNVFEKTVSEAPATLFFPDGNSNVAENVVFIGNTTVGARGNFLYNDNAGSAPAVLKMGYRHHNIDLSYNVKSDIFGSSSAHVLNWSVVHSVSIHHNAHKAGSFGGDTWAVGSWLGEVRGIGSISGSKLGVKLNLDFANDASTEGTALGGGDYTPGPASVAPLIPAGRAHAPIDLYGRPIPNDGTAVVGAIQRVA